MHHCFGDATLSPSIFLTAQKQPSHLHNNLVFHHKFLLKTLTECFNREKLIYSESLLSSETVIAYPHILHVQPIHNNALSFWHDKLRGSFYLIPKFSLETKTFSHYVSTIGAGLQRIQLYSLEWSPSPLVLLLNSSVEFSISMEFLHSKCGYLCINSTYLRHRGHCGKIQTELSYSLDITAI